MTPLPPPKRLLVIPLRYIGDTILTVPLIRNLRHHFSDTRLDVLVSKTAAPLLADCPYIDTLLVEPAKAKERIPLIRSGQYDTAIILRKSFTIAWSCQQAGIKNRIGYDKQRFMKPISFKRWGLLLDYKTPYPSRKTHVHQAISHLSHLHAFGLSAVNDYLELWTSDKEERTIQTLLDTQAISPEKPLAIIHSVSASSGKSVPIRHFASAVQHLNQTGYEIICTGLSNDISTYEKLAEASQIPIHNFAGKTTLKETFALYKRAHFILSVDSSPIHIAAAAGVPKIAGIYMTTNEKQWGPHSSKSLFFPAIIPPETPLDSPKIGQILQSTTMEATAVDWKNKPVLG